MIREGVAPWVRSLPKGIASDQPYAHYKESLLGQVPTHTPKARGNSDSDQRL